MSRAKLDVSRSRDEIHFAATLADQIAEQAGDWTLHDEGDRRTRARLVAMAEAIGKFLAAVDGRLDAMEAK